MIHVVAVITARPGQRASLLAAFHANIPAVRSEKGCVEYGVAVDAETGLPFQKKWGEDVVLVIEKWDSVEALKAHGAAPHMREFGAKTKELVAARAIHVLQPG